MDPCLLRGKVIISLAGTKMSSIGNQGRAGCFIVPANELRGGAGGEGGVRGGRGEGGENVGDGELWTCWWTCWWTRRWVIKRRWT